MANYYDAFNVRPFTLWLEIYVSSTNVAANQTTVTYKLRIRKDGNSTPWSASASPWNVLIDGVNATGSTTYDYRSMAVGSSDLIANGSRTITHNPDGSRSFTFGAAFNDVDNQLDVASISGTYVLPDIPRASEPTLSDYDFDAGTGITILSHRKSAAFTHTITYTFGGASGTIATNSHGTLPPATTHGPHQLLC